MSFDDPLTRAVLQDIVAPLIFGFVLSAGAWVVSKLPGPIKDSLYSAVHARDVALVRSTIQNKATAEVANTSTPPPTPDLLVAYAQAVLPGLLAKMQIPAPALETIATAAIAKAETELAPVAVIEKAAGA